MSFSHIHSLKAPETVGDSEAGDASRPSSIALNYLQRKCMHRVNFCSCVYFVDENLSPGMCILSQGFDTQSASLGMSLDVPA